MSPRRRKLLLALGLFALLKITALLVPHPPLRERAPSSTAVYDRDGHLLRLTLAGDQQYRLWTPLDRLSPQLREATLLYEDRWFRFHPGVNPFALVRAVRSTYGGGRRIGGSTVSMQLARRLWNLPSHTVRGKLVQLARALQLELQYTKDELLEAYLNLAPYGGNVEGAGAASLVYFGKPAARLTLGEALTLAVIPQNPEVRARDRAALGAARATLLAKWTARHPEAREVESAGSLLDLEAAPRRVAQLPFLAPHFVDEVLARPRSSPELHTTLDARLQRLLERHVRAYVARRHEVGIANAVAMLVDARTLEVVAEVGSADFGNAAISGQVNGALARRSPGSTLKPFVYALGIDQGVLHEETMLKDVPTAFAAYSPENFDGRFVGPLPAREALVRSRNIPALEVASKLNRPSLYDFLRTAGVGHLQPEAHYGLGLALGNAELTMEELVTLYAALGNRGYYAPLRFTIDPAPEHDPPPGTRVLSEAAAFMTLDMLEDNPRPGRIDADARADWPVAWKTGTSWGFRDAWSVGLFGPYVLAVWVGNFSGEGNPAFVGVHAAAPLFFEIIDSVRAARPELPALALAPPPGVRRIEVCALSGALPTASCPHKKKTWFVPGRSPIEPCPVHRRIAVDDATGRRACPRFTGPTHEEVFEVWSSDLLQLFAQAGLPRRPVPPPAPGCAAADFADGDGRPPRITSPLRGVTYQVQRAAREGGAAGGAERRIALNAITDGGAREVFWFLDDRFVGRARSGTPLFIDPEPGTFTVRAVDDLDRADSRELRVELLR